MAAPCGCTAGIPSRRDIGAVPVSGCHERCCAQPLPVPGCHAPCRCDRSPWAGLPSDGRVAPAGPAWPCPLPGPRRPSPGSPLATWQVCRGLPPRHSHTLGTGETERLSRVASATHALLCDTRVQVHRPPSCWAACLRAADAASSATCRERLLLLSAGPGIFFRAPQWEFLLLGWWWQNLSIFSFMINAFSILFKKANALKHHKRTYHLKASHT